MRDFDIEKVSNEELGKIWRRAVDLGLVRRGLAASTIWPSDSAITEAIQEYCQSYEEDQP